MPNDNYCKFEDWVMPILDQMLKEQKTEARPTIPDSIVTWYRCNWIGSI